MPDLTGHSESALLRLVAEILARPGDFTPQEKDELAEINAELQRREARKKKVS